MNFFGLKTRIFRKKGVFSNFGGVAPPMAPDHSQYRDLHKKKLGNKKKKLQLTATTPDPYI